MLLLLRSFRVTQIIGGLLLVSALLLAMLVGLGGLASSAALAQMALATPQTLAQATPGNTILLEGRISAQTLQPPNAPDDAMIVWTARLRLPGAGERWLIEDMVKQPLMLELAKTSPVRVAIINNDYGLAPLPVVINEADYVVNGLSVGDAVVVTGEIRAIAPSGSILLQARQIAFGTRADLVQHLQGSDQPFLFVVAALTLAGTLTLLLDHLLIKPKKV